MFNIKKFINEKISQKREWQRTPNSATLKGKIFACYTAVYLTFMAVYFCISEISPMWDFMYFLFHNILALSMLNRLCRFEKKRIYVLLSIIFYLNIVHDILFYLVGINNTRFFAGAYFIVSLILLLFNREKWVI